MALYSGRWIDSREGDKVLLQYANATPYWTIIQLNLWTFSDPYAKSL